MSIQSKAARFVAGIVIGVASFVALSSIAAPKQPSDERVNKAVAIDTTMFKGDKTMQTAMFGAGCFWGVEAAFRKIEGVKATSVGYAGGNVDEPTYQQVCADTTGHAEVVQVKYDPEKVKYEQLLEVFWTNHNPTQVNRQGPDYGSQYRTLIFYYDDAQKEAAEQSKKALAESGKYNKPIATVIQKAPTFWRAEEYHQQYLEKRGLATCHVPSE